MKINVDQYFLLEIFLKGESKACVEIYKYSFEPFLGLSHKFVVCLGKNYILLVLKDNNFRYT